MAFWKNQLSGPTNPITDSGWDATHTRKGFFTDTSICIGCKACEVACKEWNRVPARGEAEHGKQMLGSSFDNTGHLGANTWRHVAFVEQSGEQVARARRSGLVALGMPRVGPPPAAPAPAPASTGPAPTAAVSGLGAGQGPGLGEPFDALAAASAGRATGAETAAEASGPQGLPAVRWLMSSDVCKHCTHAGCLDVCPTGALFRTEFGTVVVQDDVCNGCGMCVAGCPFGVIGRRENGTVEVGDGSTQKIRNGGLAQKCTLCYDRLSEGQQPACSKACPTTSIKFGDHEEMVRVARERLAELHAQGHTEARLYGTNPQDGVGGTGAVFLLMDEPEAYGLPPDPVVCTTDLADMFTKAGIAGTLMIGTALAMFAGNGRRQ